MARRHTQPHSAGKQPLPVTSRQQDHYPKHSKKHSFQRDFLNLTGHVVTHPHGCHAGHLYNPFEIGCVPSPPPGLLDNTLAESTNNLSPAHRLHRWREDVR
ncbi:hypothetical protein TRVL_09222 [Trypanosoma vivax]|nr:hypothetical protein TRVL_09222 [Trypanosoma vivax]